MQLVIDPEAIVPAHGAVRLPTPGLGAEIFIVHAPAGVDPGPASSLDSAGRVTAELTRLGFSFVVILPDRVGLFADWTCRRRLYHQAADDGRITISDELGAFSARIDRALLRLVFSFKFVPAPRTPLENVFKVPAGRAVWLDRRTGAVVGDASYLAHELAAVRSERPASLRGDLEDELRRVPGRTTVFLSGGFDSTLLALLARDLGLVSTAYTVTYDTHAGRLSHDEARAAASHLGLELRTLTLDRETFGAELDGVMPLVDEPFADVATVPECALARLARSEGFEVAIEGEGADSCFGGSYKFIAERYARWLRLLTVLDPVLRRLPQNRRGPVATLLMKSHTLARALRDQAGFDRTFGFLQSAVPGGAEAVRQWPDIESTYRDLFALGSDPINAMAAATFWGVIPNLENRKLEAVERYSGMRLSTPFLAPGVVRRAFTMPGAGKIRWGYGKYPLRREFGGLLPAHVNARRKLSFVPPVGDWIIDLHQDVLERGGLLPSDTARQIIAEHRRGWRDHTATLWAVFCVERWLERH